LGVVEGSALEEDGAGALAGASVDDGAGAGASEDDGVGALEDDGAGGGGATFTGATDDDGAAEGEGAALELATGAALLLGAADEVGAAEDNAPLERALQRFELETERLRGVTTGCWVVTGAGTFARAARAWWRRASPRPWGMLTAEADRARARTRRGLLKNMATGCAKEWAA